MSTNRSSQEIPQDLIDFTKTTMLELLNRWKPYGQSIDAGEREGMVKMGESRMPMARSVQGYLGTNPEVIPAFVDSAALSIDLKNSEKVTPLQKMVQQFANELSDLLLVSNGEAYEACLSVYANVKLLAEREANPRARAIAEDLGRHFKRGPYKKTE